MSGLKSAKSLHKWMDALTAKGIILLAYGHLKLDISTTWSYISLVFEVMESLYKIV